MSGSQPIITAAPMTMPTMRPTIDTMVAAIPSLLPAFHDIAPKTIPRTPKTGGRKRKATIPQTSPAMAKPCLLLAVDAGSG